MKLTIDQISIKPERGNYSPTQRVQPQKDKTAYGKAYDVQTKAAEKLEKDLSNGTPLYSKSNALFPGEQADVTSELEAGIGKAEQDVRLNQSSSYVTLHKYNKKFEQD